MHKLLLKQLAKLGLGEDILPIDVNIWHEFINKIDKTYHDADQERYLLERSMDISSREMKELNLKLENAQRIARLGYWYYDKNTKKSIWSKELYAIFNLDISEPALDFIEMLNLIHEADVPLVIDKVEKIFSLAESFDIEVRTKNSAHKVKWLQIIVEPVKNKENEINQLTGVVIDITNRKMAEKKIKSLHQQLIVSARRAGMADVATSILHNVGNSLNSSNVSIEMLFKYNESPIFKKLYEVADLIENHLSNFNQFITTDERGKIIPEYMIKLVRNIESNQGKIIEELNNVTTSLRHIKNITALQNSVSKSSSLVEKVNLSEVIDIVIKMCAQELEANNIIVTNEIYEYLQINTDQSKLLQILVNLIYNAKDAINEKNIQLGNNSLNVKEIILRTKNYSNSIDIIVTDNGIGIEKENFNKIFSFGFTTKKNGHGYGLHSSALLAKELGGMLAVASEGIGKGAVFTLTLPIKM